MAKTILIAEDSESIRQLVTCTLKGAGFNVIEAIDGQEALDKIAEPLMSGIYNAEAEKQSLLATFPRFRDIETKHGSLIKGMVAARKARSNGAKPNGENPVPLSMFVSLSGGTGELIDSLVSQLTGDLKLDSEVARLFKKGPGYGLQLKDGKMLKANL